MTALAPIDYQDEATPLRGELALPSGAEPRPGVVVFHSGLGLGDEARERARRLAAHGFASMAADMFGSLGEPLATEDAGARMIALQGDPIRLRTRAAAALAALASHPAVDGDRMAAVGFCFGGQCALELARAGAELRAVVSLHGLLETTAPAEPGAIRGEVAVFTGARDPLAPPAALAGLQDELAQAGARWHLTIYGEGWHGFTDAAADRRYDWIRYDPLLDAQAWAGTLALLDATLTPGGSGAAGTGSALIH